MNVIKKEYFDDIHFFSGVDVCYLSILAFS